MNYELGRGKEPAASVEVRRQLLGRDLQSRPERNPRVCDPCLDCGGPVAHVIMLNLVEHPSREGTAANG